VAIFTRNCLLPIAASTTATANRCWFFREMFLAGGWTENSNDGDAAWTSASNIILAAVSGVNGLDVDAAKPREVSSPNGDFLPSHVDLILSLDATNDQNRGLWRIVEYVDANTVKVDPAGWFPDHGWVTETDMDARVTTGLGAILGNGAWTLLDSPAGYNVQVRIVYQDNSTFYVNVRPRGKLADATEIASVSFGAYYCTYQRFNGYFNDLDAMILTTQWFSNSGNQHASGVVVGALLDADAADTDPIFLLSNNNGWDDQKLNALSIRMLDSVLGQIEAYAMTVKRATGLDPDNANVDLYNIFNRRLLGASQLAALRSPWVVLANTASVGACVRGRLPTVRHTYTGFEQWTPLDAAGDWQHFSWGKAVPRNGVNDPLIMWAR